MSSSYALVTFIEKVKVYYKNEVNLVFGKYQEMPPKFRAITICNQNPFNEQYGFMYLNDKFNFYDNMIIFGLKEDIINYSEVKHFYFFLRFGLTVNQLKRNLLNDLYETELSSMEFDLGSDMLISCQFNGNLCSETN